MSIHFFAMVRRQPECKDCRVTGEIRGTRVMPGRPDEDYGPVACPACLGTGQLPERLVLHRDGKLYDEPGKASGSAKRAGYEPIVYKLDTDECEPVDRGMSLDEKLGHAEAKWLHWSARLEALQAQAAGRLTLHKHDPKLTAEDYVLLRGLIAIATSSLSSPWPIDNIEHARDLSKRIHTKVHLDQMDAEAIVARAETDRMNADWAAGKGPRKCLRVGEVDPLDDTARTACGSTVPALASTTVREDVACCGCEAALARATLEPAP